jgi:hypothetical protein
MSIILFYISFILILTMLGVKYYGITVIQHEALHSAVNKSEKHFRFMMGKGREISSKIHFKNAHKFSLMFANFVKKEAIYLKRRFDSQQPKFFLKPQNHSVAHRNSVSFFLKNVSEYKNSLRNKDL